MVDAVTAEYSLQSAYEAGHLSVRRVSAEAELASTLMKPFSCAV